MQQIKDDELNNVNGGTYTGACFPYVVKKGDCLSVIAQRYHTTVDTLCAINHIIDRNMIYAGHTLLIPYK